MQVFFIEKISKFRLIKKIILEDDMIIISKNYNKTKMIKKIISILNNYNCNKVILDKQLKNDKEFCNMLYSNQMEIVNGKLLFKKLILKILNLILKQKNINPSEAQIAIVQNSNSNEIIANILEEFNNIKNINIVTNNPQYFKNLKQKIYEEKGLVITLTNNKRKALLKSDIILNIDFPEEMINKYVINDSATIVNFEEKINILKKRFNGKIINTYSISLKNDTNIANFLHQDKFRNFDLNDIAECYILNNPTELENIIISI